MLTGAAFGIVFLYLLDAGQQAFAGQRRPGAPIGGPIDDGLGDFRSSVGQIRIAPLGEVEIGQPNGQPKGSGNDGETLRPVPTVGGGLPQRPYVGPANETDQSPRYQGYAGSGDFGGGGGGNRGGGGGGGSDPVNPDNPPVVPPVVPPNDNKELPKLVLVLVRATSQSNSRSIDGKSISESIVNQFGIKNSNVNMTYQPIPGLEVRSDLFLPGSAYSMLSDADLTVISQDVGLANSSILSGSATDIVIIGVQDLFSLVLATPKSGIANINTQSVGVAGSGIDLGDGDNFIDLQALQRLSFTALGQTDRAQLTFNLLTEGIKDSLVSMGAGSDTMLVNSGWYGGELPQDIPLLLNPSNLGISLDLSQLNNLNDNSRNVAVSLNALAVGLNNTSVNLGDGNNFMTINTAISEDLGADLGVLSNSPDLGYRLERIGMRNSQITMGAGNDTLIVNGRVINSTINLGGGNNEILLETPLEGTSKFEGNGTNRITVSNLVGSSIVGGSGDDTLTLTRADEFGSFDGGDGNNTIKGPSGDYGRRDVITINGEDQGFYNAIRLNNVGNIDTGDNNDVVIMNLGASLTGQLLGGSGLDRIEFHNWTLPITVDLDRGTASGIGSGRTGALVGFEQVKGSKSNDLLISSGDFNGIDGGLGDDVMYLRWSPWLSTGDGGLQVVGGEGKDLFVFSGLDSTAPLSWNGKSGLPTLQDFDLSFDNSRGIGLTDRIGIVQDIINPDGTQNQVFQELIPTDSKGIGNVKLLPIAPLEQLLSGMSDSTKQLAISFDPLSTKAAELILLGSNGIGTFQNIADIAGTRFDETTLA